MWRRQREIARTHPPRPHPNASKALILLEFSASRAVRRRMHKQIFPSSRRRPWDSRGIRSHRSDQAPFAKGRTARSSLYALVLQLIVRKLLQTLALERRR